MTNTSNYLKIEVALNGVVLVVKKKEYKTKSRIGKTIKMVELL